VRKGRLLAQGPLSLKCCVELRREREGTMYSAPTTAVNKEKTCLNTWLLVTCPTTLTRPA
jgi:hypothetical protein